MTEQDSNFHQQVKKLHRLTVWSRWIVVLLCWLTLGTFGLWGLRTEISLWLDYFTWAALRYALTYNPLSCLCLAVCVGMTISVLVWQSRNIIWGLPLKDQHRLERQVKRIVATGPKHPLWKWINR